MAEVRAEAMAAEAMVAEAMVLQKAKSLWRQVL